MLTGLDDLLDEHKAKVKTNGFCKLELPRDKHCISRRNISDKALKTLYRLKDCGFKSYLVGGAVRDLLLGKTPKDFDVSTNARPEQVTKVLSNSRIIGRRFKIVHVVYGNEIVEVTTFRSNLKNELPKAAIGTNRFQKSSTGALVRDNNYGKTLHGDAQRRDFTINALYYDISNFSVIDYFGGLHDLVHETIEMIGDPKTRYEEDPVRMIRAIRFAAKLGFKISRRTSAPISKMGVHLTYVSPDRMYEEVNKLLLTGYGLKSYRLLKKYELLQYIFGKENTSLMTTERGNAFIEHALSCSDERITQGKYNVPYFLYALLLFPVFETKLFECMVQNNMSPLSFEQKRECALSIFKSISCINIPYFVEGDIIKLWLCQMELTELIREEQAEVLSFKGIFRASFDLLKLRTHIDPFLNDIVEFWNPFYEKRVIQHEKEKAKKEQKRLAKIQEKQEKNPKGKSKFARQKTKAQPEIKTHEKRKSRRKTRSKLKLIENIPF